MKVVGLDPGTVATGYGVVCFEQGRLRLDGFGVWRPPAGMTLAEKLAFLLAGVALLLEECRPAAVAVETVFTARNASSAVKKALVGYGNAEKPQVRSMVLSLLARQRARVPLDAADALAVAICHIHADGAVGEWR
jgi:crossover junction endodeoxyribonuclease RuvC